MFSRTYCGNGCVNFVVSCRRSRDAQVVTNGSVKQETLLWNYDNPFAQRRHCCHRQIDSAIRHASHLWVVQTCHQLGKSGLTCTRWTNKSKLLTHTDADTHILQSPRFCSVIDEVNSVDYQFSGSRQCNRTRVLINFWLGIKNLE